MEIDRLEENLMELSVGLTALKHIIDGLDTKWDQQIYHWLQDVEQIAGDSDKMQAQLDTLRHPYASHNQNGRMELDIKEFNVKVIENLEAVQALKEAAFETLLLQITEDRLRRYSHDDLIMFTSMFDVEIGFGGFSKVYKGTLSDGVQVAVKVLKQDDKSKDVVQDIFVIEVSTMIKASHPNLIKLYGFCFDDSMKALVYEYIDNGSLDKVLFKKNIVVDWQRLYKIAIGIAKVLAYLHHDCDDQIIHHDIKPANILLDSNLVPKVTDFGVAKIMNRDLTHFTMTRNRGTSCYIAPEMTMYASRVTYTCDVYSFGMTLFDILGMRIHTQNQPSFPNQVWEKFDKGKLDDMIKECDIWEEDAKSARILSVVALWCIQFTPEIRPSMKDVVNALEKNLQVAAPPNPFLAFDTHFSVGQSQDSTYSVAASNPFLASGELFSISELPQDMTYSVVSTSNHQSVPQGNSIMDNLQGLDAECSEMELVEESPEISPEGSPEIRPSNENVQSRPQGSSTKTTLKKWGKNILKRKWLKPPETTLKQFSPEDLKHFTKNFSTRESSDGFSDVYKGEFSNGVEILVEVLKDSNGDKERFEAQIKVLSVTSHRNLIKTYGFCFSKTMKALVLEYMANGSLANILFYNHPLAKSIEWEYLYRIATETAKGIAYLHDGCDEVIIHRDIKPENVLLDFSLTPKVTNFGITPLATKVDVTMHYLDPDMFRTRRLTYKSDVYSFGVMLFEIFGRQRAYSGDVNFLQVCWTKFENGKIEEYLNERGFAKYHKDKAIILLKVAFWCVQFTPAARPPMRAVVQMLEDKREVLSPPNPFNPASAKWSKFLNTNLYLLKGADVHSDRRGPRPLPNFLPLLSLFNI